MKAERVAQSVSIGWPCFQTACPQTSCGRNLAPFTALIDEREKASLIWHLDGLTPDIEAGRGGDYLPCVKHWVQP